MSQRDDLQHALVLIRRGHTARANAVDAADKPCPVLAPQAVAWSLYGGYCTKQTFSLLIPF